MAILGAAAAAAGCADGEVGQSAIRQVRAAITCSCTGDPNTTDPCCLCLEQGSCQYVLPLPQGLAPYDVAIAAQGELHVNDRADVRASGGGPEEGIISNLGTTMTRVGVQARTGTIFSKAPVQLASYSVVDGSVYTASPIQPQYPFYVTGITDEAINCTAPTPERCFVNDTTWTKTASFPQGADPIMLEAWQEPTTVTRLPGIYGPVDVKSGRVLSLSSGTYQMERLTVEPQAGLEIHAEYDPDEVGVGTMAGRLDEATSSIESKTLSFPVVPCVRHLNSIQDYWGDYNEIEGYGDGRFFAPYTVNGPGCRWQGNWTGDMHVGGSVVEF